MGMPGELPPSNVHDLPVLDQIGGGQRVVDVDAPGLVPVGHGR